MKLLFLLAIGLILATGCSKTPKTPPPGCKILGNHNCTKFVVVLRYGTRMGSFWGNKPFRSRKGAIKQAWSYYYHTHPKSVEIDTMKLRECEIQIEVTP